MPIEELGPESTELLVNFIQPTPTLFLNINYLYSFPSKLSTIKFIYKKDFNISNKSIKKTNKINY
jgi:hypothetical protein